VPVGVDTVGKYSKGVHRARSFGVGQYKVSLEKRFASGISRPERFMVTTRSQVIKRDEVGAHYWTKGVPGEIVAKLGEESATGDKDAAVSSIPLFLSAAFASLC
jgi:hypothetical protein